MASWNGKDKVHPGIGEGSLDGPLCFIASLAYFSVPKSLYNSMRVLTEEENIDNAIKMVECAKHVMHVSKNVHEDGWQQKLHKCAVLCFLYLNLQN